MKRLLLLAALLLSLATSVANPTHSSQRTDPAVSAAAEWVRSDAACRDASTPELDWRKVSQQPMNLKEFSELAEEFRLSEPTAASRFLVCLNQEEGNKGLAETLMLHKSSLQQKEEKEAAFLHYVINTADEPKLASEKREVMKSLSDQYRESLGLRDEDITYPTTLQELRNYGIEVNKRRYGRPDVVPAILLGFEEQADGYSSRNATWMAELSVLAYWLEKPEDPRRREGDLVQTRVGAENQLEAWGYGKTTPIFDKNTDTSAFLTEHKDSKHWVLAFKGTDGLRDYITDAQVKPDTPGWAERENFEIHGGFSKALDGVWSLDDPLVGIKEALLESEGQEKPLWVTGHSLGAALAQLAALRMSLDEETRKKVEIRAVYTFGTPRIGNKEFVKAYDEKLGMKTFPHVNRNDWVTHVPPHLEATAREGGKKFICPEGHLLKPLKDHDVNLAEMAKEERDNLVGNAERLIRNALRFLEPEERIQGSADVATQDATAAVVDRGGPPQEPDSYTSCYEQGAWDEHDPDEYLFKLACNVVAEQLWPNEFEQAGMQVPPGENECEEDPTSCPDGEWEFPF